MAETRLKQERLKRGESTYETATAVGVSQSYYFRVECGTGAPREMAEALAKHFRLRVTDLFSPLRYTPEPAIPDKPSTRRRSQEEAA